MYDPLHSGGSSVLVDIGPYDLERTTQAEAVFTFTAAGSYKLCYKPFSGVWSRVSKAWLVLELSQTVTLKGLVLNQPGLTPRFTPDKHGYELEVPYHVTNVTYSATPTHPDATLLSGHSNSALDPAVPSKALQNGMSTTVFLQPGSVSELVLQVIAVNGHRKDYSIYITRPQPSCRSIAEWQPWGACEGNCKTGTEERHRSVAPEFCGSSQEIRTCQITGGNCKAKVEPRP